MHAGSGNTEVKSGLTLLEISYAARVYRLGGRMKRNYRCCHPAPTVVSEQGDSLQLQRSDERCRFELRQSMDNIEGHSGIWHDTPYGAQLDYRDDEAEDLVHGYPAITAIVRSEHLPHEYSGVGEIRPMGSGVNGGEDDKVSVA